MVEKNIQAFNIYLFLGKERFLKDEALNKIRDRLLIGQKAIDYQIYDSGDCDLNGVLGLAKTPPMVSLDRLIVIRDIHKLSEKEISSLVSYINSPCGSTVLILDTNQDKADNGLIAAVSKLGVVKAFKPIYDEELLRWIREKIKLYDKNITQDALLLLSERVGNNLELVASTLEKLIDFTKGKKDISLEDVTEIVDDAGIESMYELSDAIGRRDVKKALSALSRLLSLGKEPSEIVGLIAWHFKRLKEAIEDISLRNKPKEDIRRNFKMPSYAFAKFMNQISMFKKVDFKEYFKLLLEADFGVKRNRSRAQSILEILIINLTKP